jgi:hypothetical protein
MPLLNGLDAGRQLKAQRRSVKLIYLTMNPDPDLASEALRLGASGYVLKSSAAQELKQAIQEALRGRSYITPLITRDVVGSLIEHRAPRHELTSRQREVLQLLAEGKSMKEVTGSDAPNGRISQVPDDGTIAPEDQRGAGDICGKAGRRRVNGCEMGAAHFVTPETRRHRDTVDWPVPTRPRDGYGRRKGHPQKRNSHEWSTACSGRR